MWWAGDAAAERSVPAGSRRRRLETERALVAEEVVTGEDVVDLKAFRAGVPLADVALEKRIVANDGRPASIAEKALRLGPAARLTVGLVHHRLERAKRGPLRHVQES